MARSWGMIVAASFGMLSMTAPCSASAAVAPAGFAGGSFTPANGRIGYHMISQFGFQVEPCTSDQHVHVTDITVTGTLPPGLTPAGLAAHGGNGTPNFEGTPRQAGDWQVVATLHDLSCSSVYGAGGSVDYGDFVIPVMFHIDP